MRAASMVALSVAKMVGWRASRWVEQRVDSMDVESADWTVAYLDEQLVDRKAVQKEETLVACSVEWKAAWMAAYWVVLMDE